MPGPVDAEHAGKTRERGADRDERESDLDTREVERDEHVVIAEQVGVDAKVTGEKVLTVAEENRAIGLGLRAAHRWILASLLVLIGLFIATALMAREQRDDLVDTQEQIADCIEPTGQCYAESQARTGAAVQTLNQVTVAAAVCANQIPPPVSIAEMQACIDRELAARAATDPPS